MEILLDFRHKEKKRRETLLKVSMGVVSFQGKYIKINYLPTSVLSHTAYSGLMDKRVGKVYLAHSDNMPSQHQIL